MTPTLRQTTLPGRVRLAWTEHGKRTGTPVVALHGVTDDFGHRNMTMPKLAQIGARPIEISGAGIRGDAEEAIGDLRER